MTLPKGLKTGCTFTDGLVQAQQPAKRRNKYNAQKVKADGYTFDSKAEYARYEELKLLQQAGKIRHLNFHPRFLLEGSRQEGFTVVGGEVYEGDFAYQEPDPVIGTSNGWPIIGMSNGWIIEDVKSKPTQTRLWKSKWNRARAKYSWCEFRVIER